MHTATEGSKMRATSIAPFVGLYLPAVSGPPPFLLTLGALLTALGATLAAIARRSR
jgi:hypothetical protein